MADVMSLRQERAKAYGQLTAFQEQVEGEARAFTEDEQAEFDRLEAAVKALDGRIAVAQRAQDLRAQAALPAADPAPGNEPASGRVEPSAAALSEKGIYFAQAARAIAVAQGNHQAAVNFAAQTWGERYPVTAALQANDFSAGGATVPSQYTPELIDLWRPRTVIRRYARTRTLVGGTDSQPVLESGIAAYYLGEGQDKQVSEPSFGLIKFVEREIACIVPISDKLLRLSSINIDRDLRDDMVQGFAQMEDLAFLRGNGIGPGPRGIRYAVAPSNVIAANASVTIANIEADSRKLINQLMFADSPMVNVRWIMNPRVFGYLQDLRDANGNKVYPSLDAAQPTWKGYPVEVTNNVPRNLGSGSDSEVYLVDFDSAVIADTFQVRIDASQHAAYKVGGVMVSAYQRNQTVFRAVAAHDFGLKKNQAAAVLTGVTWGA